MGPFRSKFCAANAKISASQPQRAEVCLVLQVDQKEESILKLLQDHLGGHIGYRPSQNTYYYSTGSLANAAKLIQLLDKAHLVGSKMTQYVLWRRASLLVQRGEHKTDRGISSSQGTEKNVLYQFKKIKSDKI